MIKPISTATSIFKPAKGNALTRQVKRAKNEYIKQEVKSIANIGAVSMAMGVRREGRCEAMPTLI